MNIYVYVFPIWSWLFIPLLVLFIYIIYKFILIFQEGTCKTWKTKICHISLEKLSCKFSCILGWVLIKPQNKKIPHIPHLPEWLLTKHRIKFFLLQMTPDFGCLANFLKTSTRQKKIKFSKQKQFLIIIKNKKFLMLLWKKLKNFIMDSITISCSRWIFVSEIEWICKNIIAFLLFYIFEKSNFCAYFTLFCNL